MLRSRVLNLVGMGKVIQKSPLALEREQFVKEMKDQFVQLNKKGLGIAVFTL